MICKTKNKLKFPFVIAAGLLCASGINSLIKYRHIGDIFNHQSIEDNPSAIVVFSGDPVRACKGLEIMYANKDATLYISGDLAYYQKHGIVCDGIPTPPSPRIIFDHAVNTHDNGYRSAQWLHDMNKDSVYLVTSQYHMPRSILELSAYYNGKIIPVPVETTVPEKEQRHEIFKFLVRLAGIPISRHYQFKSI